MWSVPNRFGIPDPFVDMVKALHDGMTAKVIHQSNLLKSRRITNTINVTELQYADDNAAVLHTHAELQELVDNFQAAYTCFDLTVNKAKTKITIDETIIECVEHFPYLENILSTQSTSSKEIENRLQAGHTAYGRLSTRVFKNKDLTTHTKMMVYNAVIVSTLLYACET
ncbi:uncharacterized protein LOC143018333 [Oratosquilla oratoria]|uniref:uncharacterized protein LOC143018333 n=1 Tax=Oratosquilla oratoria TaxID=337810 RepID=UPI003F776D27